MFTLNFIRHFVEAHASYAYLLLFLGVVIEGEIVVIIAGIFAHLKSLNLFMCIVATVLGGLSKSIIGYSFGYYLQDNHSHRSFLNKITRRIHYFLPRFIEKPFFSIFISRFFIFGLNWVTLIYSGYKKVKISIYAKAELCSLAIWSVGFISLGYFFSLTALSISHDIRKFFGTLLLLFLGFFIFEKVIAFFLELGNSEYEKDNHSDTI